MFRSASLFIGTSFTVAVFTIFATSNVYSIVGIPHKIYSMQRILIHKKADLFVKCAHLHPGYAANLVARSRYYHCHWTLLSNGLYIFYFSIFLFYFTSLWPSDAIWRQRSGSTLAQVMACCLTAPSHYLNQCWLIISKIQLHSSDGNFTRDTSVINDKN